MSPDGPNYRSPEDPSLDELARSGDLSKVDNSPDSTSRAEDVEVLDTAAAGALVLEDDAGDVDAIDDDGDAPTEAGGPPAPAGERQDDA